MSFLLLFKGNTFIEHCCLKKSRENIKYLYKEPVYDFSFDVENKILLIKHEKSVLVEIKNDN